MAPFTTWPRRRWTVAAVTAPLLGVVFALVAGPPPATDVLWWLGLLAAAGVGSLVLASYVPATGWRPDLGCTPCAAMSGVTLFAAVYAFGTFGAEVSAPLVGLVATGFGLVQRLTQPETCETRTAPLDLSWPAADETDRARLDERTPRG